MNPDAFAEIGDGRDDPLLIWPDMRDSVALFFAMQTQWQWIGAGMAGAFRSGLRYEVLPTVAASLDVNLSPALFNDLRLLEQSALETWSRRRG